MKLAVRLATLLAVTICVCAAQAQQMPAEYQSVLDTLGKKGDFKAGVLKVNIPRSDLKVSVDGVGVPTSFGFGGWLAMTPGDHHQHVMMGDLVLLQDEVNPVMSALLDNGLEVTALHNHFFWDNPKIYYMHVHGHSTPADLARMVKPAIDLIGKVAIKAASVETPVSPFLTGSTVVNVSSELYSTPQLESRIVQGSFDTSHLDGIVGAKGDQLAGGVYKYTLGRDDLKLKEMGATINARMGLNTWAAFFGSDDSAVVAGDVAMLESEVMPVLKTLRSHNLEIVAIHHHMTGARPMIIFLHYWGKGRAATLAEGFKAALDELGKHNSSSHEHSH